MANVKPFFILELGYFYSMDKLFVYGTLQPNHSNHYILQNIGGVCEKATLFGYQFDKEWENQTGYPGIIKSDSSKVKGYLFTSKKLQENLQLLDDFETEAYMRKIVPITLNDNTNVNAYVYAINLEFNIKNF